MRRNVKKFFFYKKTDILTEKCFLWWNEKEKKKLNEKEFVLSRVVRCLFLLWFLFHIYSFLYDLFFWLLVLFLFTLPRQFSFSCRHSATWFFFCSVPRSSVSYSSLLTHERTTHLPITFVHDLLMKTFFVIRFLSVKRNKLMK